MLAAGMGYQITVPPNLRHLSCYAEAESRARNARFGLWQQEPPWPITELSRNAEGFHLVRGRVQRVGHSRNNVWVNLEGGLALRIQRDDLRWFEEMNLDGVKKGQEVEARGWIYRRKGERRMRVRHPSALRIDQ
jgi:hypothetical protein